MKPEPVCFLLSDISMADWFFSFNFGSENTQHFICQIWVSLFEEKKQMFDAYLASNVQNILHISIQSNLLVDIHKIDSKYSQVPAAALWPSLWCLPSLTLSHVAKIQRSNTCTGSPDRNLNTIHAWDKTLGINKMPSISHWGCLQMMLWENFVNILFLMMFSNLITKHFLRI